MIPHMKPSSGAHVGAKASVSHIMWQVMLAIIACDRIWHLVFWLAGFESVYYYRVISGFF